MYKPRASRALDDKSYDLLGQVEAFRKNHLIRLAELIKTKRSIVTFLENDKFILLCLSNQIYCSKYIRLYCFFDDSVVFVLF